MSDFTLQPLFFDEERWYPNNLQSIAEEIDSATSSNNEVSVIPSSPVNTGIPYLQEKYFYTNRGKVGFSIIGENNCSNEMVQQVIDYEARDTDGRAFNLGLFKSGKIPPPRIYVGEVDHVFFTKYEPNVYGLTPKGCKLLHCPINKPCEQDHDSMEHFIDKTNLDLKTFAYLHNQESIQGKCNICDSTDLDLVVIFKIIRLQNQYIFDVRKPETYKHLLKSKKDIFKCKNIEYANGKRIKGECLQIMREPFHVCNNCDGHLVDIPYCWTDCVCKELHL